MCCGQPELWVTTRWYHFNHTVQQSKWNKIIHVLLMKMLSGAGNNTAVPPATDQDLCLPGHYALLFKWILADPLSPWSYSLVSDLPFLFLMGLNSLPFRFCATLVLICSWPTGWWFLICLTWLMRVTACYPVAHFGLDHLATIIFFFFFLNWIIGLQTDRELQPGISGNSSWRAKQHIVLLH